MRPLATLALLAACLADPLVAQATVALRGVSVVDVRAGRTVANRTVVIRGDRIVAIGQTDSTVVPPGATIVEGSGLTVLPGLYDLHVHVGSVTDLDLFVLNGVTSIQALNAHAGIERWAREIADGRRAGPVIHPCSGPVSGLDTPAAARQVVIGVVGRGVGCLKPYDAITDSAYASLIAAARTAAVRTVSHIPRNLSWQQVLAIGPSAIAHAEEFLYSPITSAQAIDSLLGGLANGSIGLITTLCNYDLISRQPVELDELLADPRLQYISPVFARPWQRALNRYVRSIPANRVSRMRALLGFQRDLVRRADSAGVRLLAGTDAGNNFVLPGWSLHDELVELVRAGISPASALRAATISAASFLGDSLGGEVALGKRADLLLVHGNPLADIGVTRLIAGVVRGGSWLPRSAIRSRLTGIASGYTAERELVTAIAERGLAAALAGVRPEQLPDAGNVNELGYQFWRIESDTASARLVFEANARWHPTSELARETLAEFRAEVR